MQMKVLLVLAVCIIAISLAAADAIDAKDADFSELVARNDFTVVKFYAPWCGHCKRLAPEWDAAATTLKGRAGLVRVDCTVETATCQQYDVRSYPTLKVFRGGQLQGDYDGGRTAETIVKYVEGNLGPAVSTVATAAELQQLKNDNPIVVAAFVADEGTTVAVTHAAAANSLRTKYKFVRVSDSSLIDGAVESIVVYKQFDERRVTFDGDVSSVAALTAFLAGTSIKLFDEIGPENYKMYVERGIPLGWLFVKPAETNAAELKKHVADAAPLFQGKISLVWVDAEKYGGMGERLGIRKGAFPAFAIDQSGDHFVLPEDREITKESVELFIKGVLDGSVSKTVRSEPAPEQHTKDGLTTVVGSTFDELVVNAGRDVFIEFYAPWCGHCKKLQPTFEQVAKDLKDVDGIRIAQIDASSNDFNTKLFSVQGFPTLYFVPANGAPMLYEGSRSVAGILTFLKEKSTVAFEMPPEDREL